MDGPKALEMQRRELPSCWIDNSNSLEDDLSRRIDWIEPKRRDWPPGKDEPQHVGGARRRGQRQATRVFISKTVSCIPIDLREPTHRRLKFDLESSFGRAAVRTSEGYDGDKEDSGSNCDRGSKSPTSAHLSGRSGCGTWTGRIAEFPDRRAIIATTMVRSGSCEF